MGRQLDDVRWAVLMVDVWVPETRCGAELGVGETIGGRRPHPRMRNRHHPGFIAAEAAVSLGLVGSAA
jgi:hypothetical protein